ncbi:hypothetical protein BTHE_0427 [Bifidobacterium thermophilum]|nr:hypothetical protein BTHE_0427 [Bifidobacterium thermophilum]
MPSPLPVLAYRRGGLACGVCLVYGPVHMVHMVHIGERHRRQGVNETVTARHVKQDGGPSLPAWVSANLAGWRAGGRYVRVYAARPYLTSADGGDDGQVYDDYMKQDVQA